LPDTRESLGKYQDFPFRNPIFLNGFLTFFNGFPLFSTAFRFLQQISAFLNGFLLSSMAFHFPQPLSAFLFLSQMTLGLVNVVGCGPTKPFKVSEGNHDARPPPLDSYQRSRH
jgi:hypothetical protein